MKYQLKNAVQKGFSLVEMLIVIAVIGIIAAIAIPNIGNINQAAKTAKDKRNAQTIASVYQSGAAAGVIWGGTTPVANESDAANAVIAGATPPDGPFAGTTFIVPNISGEDVSGAVGYLKWEGNAGLTYNPGATGSAATTGS